MLSALPEVTFVTSFVVFSEVCAVVDVSAAFSFPHPANAVSSIAVVINAAIIFFILLSPHINYFPHGFSL